MWVQIVRNWVVKLNEQGPAGLIDRKPPGQPSRLTDAHPAALELNPQENVWQIMRDNWLSNRVFTSSPSHRAS